MKLEYKTMVKCRPEAAVAYLHDLPRYCRVHTLKGAEWELMTPDTFKQTMTMGPMKTECVYKVQLMPDGVAAEIVSGEGKATRQETRVLGSNGSKTEMYWMLAPNMDSGIPKAIAHLVREKQLAKLMLQAVKNSAKLDIEHLEKS